MTRDNETRLELARILGARLSNIVDAEDGRVTLSEFLQFEAELPSTAADALAFGESYEFKPEDVKKVAKTMSLNADLLGCFMFAVTDEYLLHVLREPFANDLNVEMCDECEELYDYITDELYRDEDINEFALAALEHHWNDEDQEDRFGNKDTYALRNTLMSVALELDEDSLKRVIAYTARELAHEMDSTDESAYFSAVARLRSDIVTAFQKNVLDVISGSETNEMDAAELQTTLGLASLTSLRNFDAILAQQIARLESMGACLTNPISVEKSRSAVTLRIDARFKNAWKQLAAVEKPPVADIPDDPRGRERRE